MIPGKSDGLVVGPSPPAATASTARRTGPRGPRCRLRRSPRSAAPRTRHRGRSRGAARSRPRRGHGGSGDRARVSSGARTEVGARPGRWTGSAVAQNHLRGYHVESMAALSGVRRFADGIVVRLASGSAAPGGRYHRQRMSANEKSRRNTIVEVADRAGVSPTTVSHVLSGNRPVRRHDEPTRPSGDRRAWLSTEQPRPESSPPTLPHDRHHRPRHHEPVLPGARTRRRRRAGLARYLTFVCNTDGQRERELRFVAEAQRSTGGRGHHRRVRFDGRRCPRRSSAPGCRSSAWARTCVADAWMPSSPTTSTAVARRPATSSRADIDGSAHLWPRAAPASCARSDITER